LLKPVDNIINFLLRFEICNTPFIKQFIKFGIVGLSNTTISYLIMVSCLFALSPLHYRYDYFIANIIAFIISVIWSFYWNQRFVFRVENENRNVIIKRLVKTYIAYFMSGIIVANYALWFFIEICDVNKYFAPILTLLITVPMNFLVIKFWAMQ